MPFVVMALSIVALRVAGAFGAPFLDDWVTATRLGLAVMFLFTGMAHFSRQRADLVRMVPPRLPAPGVLVAVTGIAQVVLALLLIWPDTARGAGIALMLLLAALFPANLHAARTAHTIAGRAHTPLLLRAPLQLVWIGLLWWSAGCAACTRGDAGDPYRPIVVYDDVRRFVTLLAPGGSADTSCANVAAYFDAASPGLRGYRRKYGVGPVELCEALRRTPERYATIGEKLPGLDSVSDSVSYAFTRFRSMYPDARIVPVYIVVGNGISGGTTTLGRNPLILIGAEHIAKTTGLSRTIVHELMHVQQDYPAWGSMTGGPEFMRGTLLRHAVKEGAADFLTELVLGRATGTREAWAEPRRAELWREFQRDMHGKDFSRWLYNGWNRAAMGDRPPDLGYYMGHEIARSYYERADDKAAAIREILTIRDFEGFLARSGYRGERGDSVTADPSSRARFVD
jgi:uncharacterized membrane protein